MEEFKIKIEEKKSKKDFIIYAFFVISVVIIYIAAVFVWGMNFSLRIAMFMVISLVLTLIFVETDCSDKTKYLSEIIFTRDFIFFIYKVQNKIVERKEIEVALIEFFKIEIEVEKPIGAILTHSYLAILVKLINGEKITNCQNFDSLFQKKHASRIEEIENQREDMDETIRKKRISGSCEDYTKYITKKKNLIELLEFYQKMQDDVYLMKTPVSGGYNFLFDFIAYESIIHKCELEIKTNKYSLKKEIDYYKKYGRRKPFFEK